MKDHNKKLFRTIHPEVKVVDAAKGIVEYVASDETLDSHREVILSKGWKFTRFRKNAPFLNSHSSWSIDDLLGKVISAEVINGQLIERVQWAIDVPDNDMARLGFAMTEAGYLKAVSVGFFPTKQSYRDSDGWSDAVKLAGLDGDAAAMVRRIFIEQEQIELSSVVIGSNANALAKAFEDGTVAEEQLARCGFDTDEKFDFLTKAAAAVENPEIDPVMESWIAVKMGEIYAGRKHSPRTQREKPDPSAQTRAAADDVQRRAASQKKFLDQLDRLTR